MLLTVLSMAFEYITTHNDSFVFFFKIHDVTRTLNLESEASFQQGHKVHNSKVAALTASLHNSMLQYMEQHATKKVTETVMHITGIRDVAAKAVCQELLMQFGANQCKAEHKHEKDRCQHIAEYLVNEDFTAPLILDNREANCCPEKFEQYWAVCNCYTKTVAQAVHEWHHTEQMHMPSWTSTCDFISEVKKHFKEVWKNRKYEGAIGHQCTTQTGNSELNEKPYSDDGKLGNMLDGFEDQHDPNRDEAAASEPDNGAEDAAATSEPGKGADNAAAASGPDRRVEDAAAASEPGEGVKDAAVASEPGDGVEAAAAASGSDNGAEDAATANGPDDGVEDVAAASDMGKQSKEAEGRALATRPPHPDDITATGPPHPNDIVATGPPHPDDIMATGPPHHDDIVATGPSHSHDDVATGLPHVDDVVPDFTDLTQQSNEEVIDDSYLGASDLEEPHPSTVAHAFQLKKKFVGNTSFTGKMKVTWSVQTQQAWNTYQDTRYCHALRWNTRTWFLLLVSTLAALPINLQHAWQNVIFFCTSDGKANIPISRPGHAVE